MFKPNEIVATLDLGMKRGRRHVLEMKKAENGAEAFDFVLVKIENDTEDNPETLKLSTTTGFGKAYSLWQALLDIYYCGHTRGFELAESLR